MQKKSFMGQSKLGLYLLLLILASCSPLTNSTTPLSGGTTPTAHILATPNPAQLLANTVQKMTLEEKLGQMVIVEFYGPKFNADLNQMLQKNHVGGVLIENNNDNAQSRNQLIDLNKALQDQSKIPLFISTDYEGGQVNELRQITGERPSEATIGASNDPQVAHKEGFQAAADLKALGLNVNFMPIVDVLTNPNNPGLPQRTFGSNPDLVTRMGRAYLQGLTEGNVIGCLKHFPGLGSATIDPHLSLPTMDRNLATLNTVDLAPYQTLIKEGDVPMVMVTHILNPQLDAKLPTSLSPNVVTNLLRNQLSFEGVIISDTLWMGGVSNKYDLPQAAVLAVKAGTDLLLGPRGPAQTQQMLSGLEKAVTSGEIPMSQIDASVTRILALKRHYQIVSQEQLQTWSQTR